MNKIKKETFLLLLFCLFSGIAMLISFLKTEKILIGYELGKLKKEETSLLREKSLLEMDKAKLTRKESLIKLSRKVEH